MTFYGDPAKRDHTGNANIPFFTNPTGCAIWSVGGYHIHVDSWQKPGRFNADGTPDSQRIRRGRLATSESPPVTGCNALQFTPELSAQPTTHMADSPSGLEFEMKLPQTEDASVSATPALKNAEVTLPEGMTVDPSAGGGLEACSEAQIGWLGGSLHNFSPGAPECPEASKIGSLELETPLIPRTLTGALYIAQAERKPVRERVGGICRGGRSDHGCVDQARRWVPAGSEHGSYHRGVRRKPTAAVQRL